MPFITYMSCPRQCNVPLKITSTKHSVKLPHRGGEGDDNLASICIFHDNVQSSWLASDEVLMIANHILMIQLRQDLHLCMPWHYIYCRCDRNSNSNQLYLQCGVWEQRGICISALSTQPLHACVVHVHATAHSMYLSLPRCASFCTASERRERREPRELLFWPSPWPPT